MRQLFRATETIQVGETIQAGAGDGAVFGQIARLVSGLPWAAMWKGVRQRFQTKSKVRPLFPAPHLEEPGQIDLSKWSQIADHREGPREEAGVKNRSRT